MALLAARTPATLAAAVLGGALVLSVPVAADAAPRPTSVTARTTTLATQSAQATTRVVVLRKGSHGAEVTRLQRRLHVTATGTFGVLTVAAVKKFQHAHKIAASGVVNAATWRLLVRYTSPAPIRRIGDRGAWVKALQKDLGVTPRSGYFGTVTKAAVVRYQKKHRLTPSGAVGGRMWAMLGHGGSIPTVKVAVSRSKTRGRTCPVPGSTFTDTYGDPRAGHTHKGVDMFKYRGAAILAIETGTVVRAHWSGSSGGWTITLKGTSGAKFFYAHNDKNLVKSGQHVTMGAKIATMGDTGDAKGNPQLHFEYWPSGKESTPVNPTPLVRSLC